MVETILNHSVVLNLPTDPAYGVTVDYVYDTLNVTHSYTVELRPTDKKDRIGFLLPPCQIISTGNEMIAALKAITAILAKEIREAEK